MSHQQQQTPLSKPEPSSRFRFDWTLNPTTLLMIATMLLGSYFSVSNRIETLNTRLAVLETKMEFLKEQIRK